MVLVRSVCLVIFCLLILAFRSLAKAETPSPEDVLVGSVHTMVLERFRRSEDKEVLLERSVVTHDHYGRVIESAYTDYGDGESVSELKGRFVYTYDVEGKSEETVHYRGDGSVSSKDVIFFDDKGNCTEVVNYPPEAPEAKELSIGVMIKETGLR